MKFPSFPGQFQFGLYLSWNLEWHLILSKQDRLVTLGFPGSILEKNGPNPCEWDLIPSPFSSLFYEPAVLGIRNTEVSYDHCLPEK